MQTDFVSDITWLPVKDYEGIYEVSNKSVIRNVKTGMIKRAFDNHGTNAVYKRVTLYKDGKKAGRYVHRIVAAVHVPNPDPENKIQVHHENFITTFNHADNLRWVTPSENKRAVREEKVEPMF